MITRTFLDKCTTIIRDSNTNYGLNPIAMLNYGPLLSRFLVHFDLSKVSEQISDGTYADISKVRHILRMKNCASVNPEETKQKLSSPDYNGIKERATSFTVIAYKLPQIFDEGVGFDNANDFWITGKASTSTDGATWFKSTNEEIWPDNGIYSAERLELEYERFLNGNESIIVASQHFDHGNENLELDITNYVNDCLFNEKDNFGLCISFVPSLEEEKNTKITQYVGFFNNKTNTIFDPVLETRYDCNICDDRYNFVLNKENKLYLYSFIGGKLSNLDNIPSCRIETPNYDEDDPIELIATQEGKGIYSVSLNLSSRIYRKDMVLYDTWYNLYYQNEALDDAELQFATVSSLKYFSVGNKVIEPKVLNPIVVGINGNEKVNRGEERMIKVFYREPYTHSDFKLVNESWYRIYAKDGDREVTIVDWDKLLKMGVESFFTIRTNEFVPTEYHVDIKAKFGDEVRIFKNELTFKIVSDVTEEQI